MTQASSDRLYPPRPVLAASIAVFRGDRVLVARRAKMPLRGLYSLPGGVVEIGETLREAALRELMEEVGVEAEIVAFNDHIEAITGGARGVETHYVIATFAGIWTRGEPKTSAEADRVLWASQDDLALLSTTPGLARIVARAGKLVEAAR